MTIKRRGKWELATVLMPTALLALAACDDGAKQQAAAPQPPAVTTMRVASKPLTPTLTFTGRIEAVDRVDLLARVAGYLDKRLFEEGAEVREGDLLFVIEKAPYQTEVNRVKAGIAGAQAALTRANLDFGRQEQLAQREVASQARLDTARSQQGQSQADVMAQKAALEKAELDLGYTDIKSPVTGRIGRAQFSVGSFVNPSSGTLATVVRQDPMYVTFPVSQRELLAVRQRAIATGGDPRAVKVRLRLADGSIYRHAGSLNFVDVQVSPTTDTVAVRATLPNPDRLLIDRQIVGVIVETAEPTVALFIPQQALQVDQTGPFVLVVDKEEKVEVRRIQLGPGREGEAVVAGGLQEGERVITEGVQKVRPRQVVQATDGGKGS